MSVSISPTGTDRVSTEAHPGRRLAIVSLLMVPTLLAVYVPLSFLGTALQNALEVAEGELLIEAGLLGVLAWTALLVLVAVPQVVGIVFGRKARLLGDRRLGTIGIVVNAVVGGYVLVVAVAQAVLEVLG